MHATLTRCLRPPTLGPLRTARRTCQQRPAASPCRRALVTCMQTSFSEASQDFESSLLGQELQGLAYQGTYVEPLLDAFPFMDIPGKRVTVAFLESLCQRWEVMMARLRLTQDDPDHEAGAAAGAALAYMQMPMLERSATWEGFFQARADFFNRLRAMVDAEEHLQLAGKPAAAEEMRERQAAWIQGRFEEWQDSHPLWVEEH